MNTKININMTGKEYIEYNDRNKIKLSKPVKKAIPYFILTIILCVILGVLATPTPTTNLPIDESQNNYIISKTVSDVSWNDIGKTFVMRYSTVLLFVIGLGWVLHGVGFAIIKG